MTLTRRSVLFGIYTLGVIALGVPALRSLVDLSMRDATASHLVLVPVVVAVLLFQERRAIFRVTRWSTVGGAPVILAGLLLVWAAIRYQPSSAFDDSLTLKIGALVLLWLGGFVLFFGATAFRRGLFPLLFLGFMTPIPGALLAAVVQFLKTGSTEMVAGLLSLTGTPYFREGFVFAMPTVTIEIVDACSGIRSSIALLLTTLLAGYMFLERPWSRVLLVAVMVPITLFKNAVRIVGLSLLAMHVDPGFLTGQLHHDGGIVFFLLALAMLAPVLAALRRAEASKAHRAPEMTPNPGASRA